MDLKICVCDFLFNKKLLVFNNDVIKVDLVANYL